MLRHKYFSCMKYFIDQRWNLQDVLSWALKNFSFKQSERVWLVIKVTFRIFYEEDPLIVLNFKWEQTPIKCIYLRTRGNLLENDIPLKRMSFRIYHLYSIPNNKPSHLSLFTLYKISKTKTIWLTNFDSNRYLKTLEIHFIINTGPYIRLQFSSPQKATPDSTIYA